MRLTNSGSIPVYTIAGSSTARPLPEWLARKRKRSLKNDAEYANRVELLQDFEFEEASSCIRVSEDGDWLMSTGTYKPQIHVHHLPQLSLSFARHTNSLNQKFCLISSDYTKSLHLQSDRLLEFHNPGGLYYSTRIPRYGRDLIYVKKSAEALVPAVGVNENGKGEVFRLNLELGRFMKAYEVDVGNEDMDGSLQGGVHAGAVNAAAAAETSHNMLAFGTSVGTVEFWDSRSRTCAATLDKPHDAFGEVTALEFHSSGLQLAVGSSTGLINLYDLRSSEPLLRKDQGYDEAIKNLRYMEGSDKIMSADKKIIKIWDSRTGDAWTSVEPAVDLNHVEWVPNTGMILTANEGRQQHSFFIPQLGPAPKWCAFLDNLVEEMAEDAEDPNAFKKTGQNTVYDNYKFLSTQQLRELNMDHLVGQTSLLRPYMHGYFVAQKLYEQARLISNPLLFEQEREKTIQEKISKERESRIRGSKAAKVKVNRRFAEKMVARDEANERRKARRLLLKQGDDAAEEPTSTIQEGLEDGQKDPSAESSALIDPRFASLFQNEDFEIDETSREFALANPATALDPNNPASKFPRRGLTAPEEEMLSTDHNSDSTDDHDDEDDEMAISRQRKRRGENEEAEVTARDKNRVTASSYTSRGKQSARMVVSSSTGESKPRTSRDNSFGTLSASLGKSRQERGPVRKGGEVGEKSVSFVPSKVEKKYRRPQAEEAGNEVDNGRKFSRAKERRSASGNTFRNM